MRHIAESYPEEQDVLMEYCKGRQIDFVLSSGNDLSSSLSLFTL